MLGALCCWLTICGLPDLRASEQLRESQWIVKTYKGEYSKYIQLFTHACLQMPMFALTCPCLLVLTHANQRLNVLVNDSQNIEKNNNDSQNIEKNNVRDNDNKSP